MLGNIDMNVLQKVVLVHLGPTFSAKVFDSQYLFHFLLHVNITFRKLQRSAYNHNFSQDARAPSTQNGSRRTSSFSEQYVL